MHRDYKEILWVFAKELLMLLLDMCKCVEAWDVWTK